MTRRDYYEVLGISRSAAPQEIKSAYRKLAIRYHPDKNTGDKASEEKFKEASEAYSVLSDTEKRARYDQFGHAGLGSESGGFQGFDPDIFSDFGDVIGDFFGFGGSTGQSRSRHGDDLRFDLTISFKEAALGVKTKIKIPRRETCANCKGIGADPKSGLVTCSTCGGQGSVRHQQGFFTIARTCSNCQGSGQFIEKACSECRGNGYLQNEKVLEIKIPAGISDGACLKVSREGQAGPRNGPRGDLYVMISIEEHPFFKRKDQHIFCTVPITFSTAALGGKITVPTFENKEQIKIPAGTQSDTVFRLKGRGIVNLNGRGKGDQLVQIIVVTPTKLTQEETKLLKRLDAISEKSKEAHSLFKKVREMLD